MLIENLMNSIYKRFEKSIDDPDKSSEDYLVRIDYVNGAISKWELEIGIAWKELFKTMSETLVDGIYNGNDEGEGLYDFKRPDDVLKIGSDKYTYVRPENVEKTVRLYPSKKVYTIEGSKGEFELKVFPIISADFTLPYIKEARQYETGLETAHIQMSDPEYIINDVLAQLYLDDENTTQANVSVQIANSKIEAMKLVNEIDPFNNNNGFPEDEEFKGFGK